MGATQSKSKNSDDQLDQTLCNLVMSGSRGLQVVKAYVRSSLDALLAVRFTVNKLATEHTMEAILKPMHLKRYREIDTKKLAFIADVQTFADTIAKRLRIVKRRINDNRFETLQECWRGWDRESTLTTVGTLQERCTALQSELANFRKDFENEYGYERVKRGRHVMGWFFGIAAVVLAGVVVLSACGVGLALSSVVVGILATGAALSAVVCAGSFMLKTEIERAEDFLKNTEASLKNLRNHISAVRSSTDALSMADRSECAEDIQTIIDECEKIVAVCQKIPVM